MKENLSSQLNFKTIENNVKSFSYLYWYIIRSSKKIKGPNSIRNTYHFDINEKLLFQKT